MEWLKALLEKAAVSEEGKLDVQSLTKAIMGELPKHTVPKTEFNDKSGELKTANATIETLKKDNEGNQELQETIKTHETTIAALQREKETTVRTFALQSALKEAGCTEPEYMIFKHGGLDKFTFDGEGKPTGVEEVIKPYKESNKLLFPTGCKQQDYRPMGGTGGTDRNPFAKETWNMTEQGKLFKENPVQAKEMADAAGVSI